MPVDHKRLQALVDATFRAAGSEPGVQESVCAGGSLWIPLTMPRSGGIDPNAR